MKVYHGDERKEESTARGRSNASNSATAGPSGSPLRKRARHRAAPVPPPGPSAPKRNAMSAFMLGGASVTSSGIVTGVSAYSTSALHFLK